VTEPQPLIAVHDVAASSRWYQGVLGCKCGHGGGEYEQLLDGARKMILQLHLWDREGDEHPHMGDPAKKPYGNGVPLWFQVDDFAAAVARVRALPAEILQGPMTNPNAKHREIWLRDPDGYVVVLAGARGDV
jgi:catechol 2,3-dioxygenase-like lactoylglutathione lyase family enzyme